MWRISTVRPYRTIVPDVNLVRWNSTVLYYTVDTSSIFLWVTIGEMPHGPPFFVCNPQWCNYCWHCCWCRFLRWLSHAETSFCSPPLLPSSTIISNWISERGTWPQRVCFPLSRPILLLLPSNTAVSCCKVYAIGNFVSLCTWAWMHHVKTGLST